MNKKGLIALGLAAFAYYRYNRMSAEEKAQWKDKLRNAGKSAIDKLPPDIRKAMGLDKEAEDIKA